MLRGPSTGAEATRHGASEQRIATCKAVAHGTGKDRSLATPPGRRRRPRRDRGAGLRHAVGRQQPVGGAGAAVPGALEHADRRHGDPQRVAARAGRRRRAARRAGARVPRALPARDRHRASRGDRGVHEPAGQDARVLRRPRRGARSPCRATSAWRPRWGRRCSTSRRSARWDAHVLRHARAHALRARAASGPTCSSRRSSRSSSRPTTDAARAAAREYAALYLGLRNYTNNLLRFGFTERDVADGGSDRLIDAVIPHGSAEQIAEAVRAHLDAGADHVALQPLGHGPAPVADYEALAGALL